MKYLKTIEGIFLKRPNRFIAHVLINDVEEIVHVRNTGRCREILIPGVKVILEDCSNNLNRKTKYSLIAVWKENMLINMDSQIPNAVAYEALCENKIQGYENLTFIKREVTFGHSRYDIYFERDEEKGFIEVKGVTLEDSGVASFPDAPTERGAKHVLEMIEAIKQGYKGAILFLIQMKGPKLFKPNWIMDENFCQAIKLAHDNGVEILVYDSIVKNDELYIGERINMNLSKF